MLNLKKTIIAISLIFTASFAASGQAKTRKPVAKKPVVKKPASTPESEAAAAPKKNERPSDSVQPASAEKVNKRDAKESVQDRSPGFVPTHFYYFTQPDFVVSSVTIQHDDAGKGNITFQKKDLDESMVEPLQLSPMALEKISTALKALNFVSSNENYQYDKDYSHLGNMKFRVKRDGLDRTAAFNYTTNKDAKVLADEYRKLSNQAIWIFDINIARQNQPLETPSMMNALDSYIRRNEISDLVQLGPFIEGLSNDERLPLIARNHASRILKEVEKQSKKK